MARKYRTSLFFGVSVAAWLLLMHSGTAFCHDIEYEQTSMLLLPSNLQGVQIASVSDNLSTLLAARDEDDKKTCKYYVYQNGTLLNTGIEDINSKGSRIFDDGTFVGITYVAGVGARAFIKRSSGLDVLGIPDIKNYALNDIWVTSSGTVYFFGDSGGGSINWVHRLNSDGTFALIKKHDDSVDEYVQFALMGATDSGLVFFIRTILDTSTGTFFNIEDGATYLSVSDNGLVLFESGDSSDRESLYRVYDMHDGKVLARYHASYRLDSTNRISNDGHVRYNTGFLSGGKIYDLSMFVPDTIGQLPPSLYGDVFNENNLGSFVGLGRPGGYTYGIYTLSAKKMIKSNIFPVNNLLLNP